MIASGNRMGGWLGVVLLLVYGVGPVCADQRDDQLGPLFDQLKNATGVDQAKTVETQIWRIWLKNARPEIKVLMRRGLQAMAGREMSDAYRYFDQVVRLDPDYAEGWNKRATVLYLQDELRRSMLDIEHTLRLEPRHFGALSGMGLIFAEVEDNEGALQAFEAVLEIHPYSATATASAEELRATLGERML